VIWEVTKVSSVEGENKDEKMRDKLNGINIEVDFGVSSYDIRNL